MRMDTARVLLHMGYVLDRDFYAVQDGPNSVALTWLAATPAPTEAEIDAAAPAAQAAAASQAALLAELGVDKSTLASAYQAMHDRLVQIENAAAPTNAQVIQAVRDLALYERRILRVLRAILG